MGSRHGVNREDEVEGAAKTKHREKDIVRSGGSSKVCTNLFGADGNFPIWPFFRVVNWNHL